jgi:hypothetical protein
MHVAALYRYSTRRNTLERSDRAAAHGEPTRGHYTAETLPEALPCHKSDRVFSSDAEVWGNVLVKDEAELQRWVEFCRPTSREVAEAQGCCVIFQPSATTSPHATAVEPQYYCITATDDVVYGRAAYVARDESLDTASVAFS